MISGRTETAPEAWAVWLLHSRSSYSSRDAVLSVWSTGLSGARPGFGHSGTRPSPYVCTRFRNWDRCRCAALIWRAIITATVDGTSAGRCFEALGRSGPSSSAPVPRGAEPGRVSTSR